jgi:hypothetical protein
VLKDLKKATRTVEQVAEEREEQAIRVETFLRESQELFETTNWSSDFDMARVLQASIRTVDKLPEKTTMKIVFG